LFGHADDAADEVLTPTGQALRSSINRCTSPVLTPAHGGHGMTTVASVLFAILVLASVPALGADEVKIVGRDFTFDAPAVLRAGKTAFAFENPGQVRHEMMIWLLRPGVTEQQVQDAHQA